MSSPWIILPDWWDMGSLRAVLAFLINFLCAIGIWVVSHVAWKSGARETSKGPNANTKVLSLLSLGGLGDVIDTLPLLRRDVGTGLLTKLVLQCLATALLSMTAMLAGPIARYSTRFGRELREMPVSGWRATPDHNSMDSAQVKWNNTIERLKSTGFPLNQLLDYMPDVQVDWKYDESQWNSSWASDCRWTDQTAIELNATGSDTGGTLDWIPGIASVFPVTSRTPAHNVTFAYAGAYESLLYKDVMLFVVVQSNPEIAYLNEPDPSDGGWPANYLPFDLTLAAFYLQNATAVITESRKAVIGAGPIERSWYTMADCRIRRDPFRTPDRLSKDTDWHVAFPWTADLWALPRAFVQFYGAGVVEGSFTGQDIPMPSGPDLFRFYQAYMINKDTQYHKTATRQINVAIPTVELSIPALAAVCLYIGLLCTAFVWSLFWRLPGKTSIPKTKVEWMMQSVREICGRDMSAEFFGATWIQLRPRLREAVYGECRVRLGDVARPY
ncbi:hypothetical protein B0I37DRAFT_23084 [Chaetomium sp. MPI-CAGE-AT-0009]|nr:hypothetical protein B0I37DRAFT_23084 [Chaetomium sp. MPI-CAGE-AT-0009]